ncbi:VOC family protein [Aeromonas schubertii]|uniref:VOC family protein n=1 Tax=Aeromonas schubertii TaxID=652 RepID=A0ABS7VC86_9GAMM|nr:VOC family protein [Aeromonas schubertii]MBZ6067010.1 VOC family protein [Aeromonas schubertii]
MRIASLDHLVLTVTDLDRTLEFYRDVLGMEEVRFGEGRVALAFGSQKINLHRSGQEFEPKAARVMVGSGDLCFIVTTALERVAAELGAAGIPVEAGPVHRTGATGPLLSLYVRDPDGNLIELANRA